MKFHIELDGLFEALDIDDAFLQLALHFMKVACGEDSELFFPPTGIDITLMEEE